MSTEIPSRSEVLPTEGPHLSVVIPAYNEEARIGSTLDRMLAYFDLQDFDVEILVVDDGSTDATRAVVRATAGEHPNVRILHYDGNHGKGFAVRYGMTRAEGDYVLFSDADESTPIREVEKLYEALRSGSDVAIGSRDVASSKLTRHQSALREAGGKLFNRFVQMLAVPGIHDTQCGFKLFTRAAAQNIFSRCQIDNFSFDVEALYIARQLGYTISEVGIEWHHCEGSKVSYVRDSVRMLGTLFRIRATDYQVKHAGMRRTIRMD
jgi:dolichyl-phosphate beta-glucosyltransferase